MKKVFLAALLAAAPLVAPAAAELHGDVKVDTKLTGDNLEFTFKVEPKPGLEINLEGPWKLELKTSDGMKFAKTTLGRGEFDDKSESFKFATTAKPSKPSGEIEYKFVTFVCTKAKTQCFRDVHEGKTPWSMAAK
jgi:hypothetical protein